MNAGPLRADEAIELAEVLAFTAEVLNDNAIALLTEADMDLCDLRVTLMSWSMRLSDTPANAGLQ